jgi:hypothetical protein
MGSPAVVKGSDFSIEISPGSGSARTISVRPKLHGKKKFLLYLDKKQLRDKLTESANQCAG